MIKLSLCRHGDVLLLTVPPLSDLPELEWALSSARVSALEFYEILSETESTVLELPRQVWKRFLKGVFYDYKTKVALKTAQRAGISFASPTRFQEYYKTFDLPVEKRLVVELDGVEYESAKDFPKDPPIYAAIGAFELTQPALRVTDPNYRKTSRDGHVLKALPGRWRAEVMLEDDGPRGYGVARLTVVHETCTEELDYSRFDAEPACFAGVDSAQCGFFDDARYPADEAQFEYDDHTFYGKICDSLLSVYDLGESKYRAAIAPEGIGAASATFYGDGAYACRVLRNPAGDVVAAYLWYESKPDPFFSNDDEG